MRFGLGQGSRVRMKTHIEIWVRVRNSFPKQAKSLRVRLKAVATNIYVMSVLLICISLLLGLEWDCDSK